jgi:hypothetical protein
VLLASLCSFPPLGSPSPLSSPLAQCLPFPWDGGSCYPRHGLQLWEALNLPFPTAVADTAVWGVCVAGEGGGLGTLLSCPQGKAAGTVSFWVLHLQNHGWLFFSESLAS